MKQLPTPPSKNEAFLAQEYRERFTGSTASTLTLSYQPVQTQDGVNLVRLYKNGALLDDLSGATGYTISGATITLGSALVVSDIVNVYYPYRV